MGLSGGKVYIKYIMFIFNFLFFIMGCALLGVGIWLKVDKGQNEVVNQFFSKYDFVTASNIAIGAGAVIIVISFLGCCGAIKEVRAMLIGFFILMLLIFIAEVVAGALAYTKRNELKSDIEEDFEKAIMNDYGTPNKKEITQTIDTFQITFQCCGYNDYNDYRKSNYSKTTSTLPASCCKKETTGKCPTDDPSLLTTVYYQEGCFDKVKEFLKDNLLLIGGLTIAFAIIQILGMVFSIILFRAIGGQGEFV